MLACETQRPKSLANCPHSGREKMVIIFAPCSIRRGHSLRIRVCRVASVLVALQMIGSGAAQSLQGTAPPSAASLPTTSATGAHAPEKGSEANVKNFGAVGDGVTNDTAAFNAALESLAKDGGVCLVPKGIYLISPSGITRAHVAAVRSGVRLVGEGRKESVLRVNGMPTNHLLQCEGDNWSVENLTFDMGDYTPLSIGFSAISCRGNNWRVTNCAIIRSGRWAIQTYGGSDWSIDGNYIKRTVPGATPPTGAILVTAQQGVWSRRGRVSDNVCEGVGITFAGDDGIIAHNRISRSGSGSGIFVQGPPSTHAPTIRDNVWTDGSSGYDAAQGGRWWSVNGFEIWAADAVIYNNTACDNDGGGFAIGGPNSVVVGNKAYNNGRGRHGHGGFIARVNLRRGTSASHSIFVGNVAYDTRYPSSSATQDFGYVEQAADLTDIKQFGNDYSRNRVRPTKSETQIQHAEQLPISSATKKTLKTLANDRDLPDNARRALQECLAR